MVNSGGQEVGRDQIMTIKASDLDFGIQIPFSSCIVVSNKSIGRVYQSTDWMKPTTIVDVSASAVLRLHQGKNTAGSTRHSALTVL